MDVTRQTVAIKRSAEIWIDALVFEALVQQALRTSPSGLLNEAELNTLTEAVNLYRGEFLDGFSLRDGEPFDNWVRSQSIQYHQSVTQALHKLVTHYLAAEDYQAGIAWARRLIELDEYNEAARRDMMRLLLHSGQTMAAIQEYEALRRLMHEGNVAPAEDTTALYNQLLQPGRHTPTGLSTDKLATAFHQRRLSSSTIRLDEQCRRRWT